jgi:hypothetical protein
VEPLRRYGTPLAVVESATVTGFIPVFILKNLVPRSFSEDGGKPSDRRLGVRAAGFIPVFILKNLVPRSFSEDGGKPGSSDTDGSPAGFILVLTPTTSGAPFDFENGDKPCGWIRRADERSMTSTEDQR